MAAKSKTFDAVSANAMCNFDLSAFANFVADLIVDKLSKDYLTKKEKIQYSAAFIAASVTADHITCLECAREMRMLKSHIRTKHKMTPDEYRKKWNLDATYPMTAANHSKVRSNHAKDIGLGKKNSRRRKKK